MRNDTQNIIPPSIDLNALSYTRDILKAQISLYEFLKQSWAVIENGVPFDENWHLQAISEHLEACFYRNIKKLLINVPPRTGKTTLISIVFPAWVWLHKPNEKFMYASYATSLSIEHSSKCRRLIESPWYQERWGSVYKLCKDQNAKSFFENDQNGYRIATSVGASATGKGASVLIADDPNNMKFVDSSTIRNETNKWLDQVWSTRLNDPVNDIRIIVQQRGHYSDVTGHILDKDINNEWVVLRLPMEFELSNKCSTIVLPSTNGKIWEDKRTTEKELLCPARMPEHIVESLKIELGSYAYAAQFQQRPSPEGGGLIKTSWFKWWKDSVPPDIEFVLQSWDTAYSKKETAAYSACTTWGVFYDDHYIPNLILLSVWRDRLEYHELRERAKRLYFDYRDTAKEKNVKLSGRPIDMVLIEAKATGDPLIKDLMLAGIPTIPFNPTGLGKKESRSHFITPIIEGGRVWLPAQPPNYNTLLPWAADFLEAVASFPSLESNDLVDTMSQALTKLKDGGFVLPPHPILPRPSEKSIKLY